MAKNNNKDKSARLNVDVNATPKHTRGIETQPESEMALGKMNFVYMAIAGVMIIVGFLLMLGPSATPDHYEPDIFSTRRIVVGPTLAFLGFLAMAIAIIVSPRKSK